jgi:hypothetical protein
MPFFDPFTRTIRYRQPALDGVRRWRRWGAGVAMISIVFAVASAAGGAAPATPKQIANIDLAKAFGARSAWRFVATQKPEIADPEMGPIPGAVRLCLKKVPNGPCDMAREAKAHLGWSPHSLEIAKLVYPRGRSGQPLLLVRTSGVPIFDGNHSVLTQVIAYRRGPDRFATVYDEVTWTNNNQEIRYVVSGPLMGSMIWAEPADHAPFGYWISVSKLTPAYRYKQVLHYLSATRYNDGNSLAVIDSEMPNIERRLGLWRPGSRLPLPAGRCPKPRLKGMALWCT